MHHVGIEIGGTKLQVVVGDRQARIVDRHRFRVDTAKGGSAIRDQLAVTLPALVRQWQAASLGVGFGGPVDHRTGRISCSHQVEGWSEFPFGDWLRRLTGLPVAVDNDANTAALAEAALGVGRGFDPVFYVTLGSGVGGGCVVRGQIYHGALPGEAEIGHLRLDRHGTIVEQRCSGWAVDRRIREAVQHGARGVLAELASRDPGSEARHLAPALTQRDPVAQQILADTADDLAFALSHVTHLFHPAVIALGGGLSLLGEALLDAVAARLPASLMDAFRPGPRLALAALREDAVPSGALLLAIAAGGEPRAGA